MAGHDARRRSGSRSLQIIGVNIILSGDNAVVIAMACRDAAAASSGCWGMILGAGVAVLLRVIFTLVIAQAMGYPYLKLVGGLLLFWVAIKLSSPRTPTATRAGVKARAISGARCASSPSPTSS